jgi:hypothetical protein
MLSRPAGLGRQNTSVRAAKVWHPWHLARWARQALFFLVWSCPRPAAEGMLTELMPNEDEA